MEKLLFIDSCIRGELSNTRKIALPLIEKLKEKYEVTTLTINDLKLDIVQEQLLAERQKGNVPEYVVEWANLIKNCDRLVIAAPFWDMSFPSSLKVFIELASLFNITFAVNDKTCYGLCKCKKTLYINTRGMNIPTRDKLDGATPYLECLSHLWGLGPIEVLSAYNMDFVCEEEKQNKVNNAIKEGLELIKDF